MGWFKRFVVLAGACGILAGVGTSIASGKGTLTTLVSFSESQQIDVSSPPIFDSAGNLYTTGAYAPGSAGSIIELPAGSSTPSIIPFDFTDGMEPLSPLIVDSSGNVYGVTPAGGASFQYGQSDGVGTIFEIPHGSNTIQDLVSFSGSNGSYPDGPLLLSGGSFYGTTAFGGQFGDGTIFKFTPGGAGLTTLASFDSSSGNFAVSNLTMDLSGDLFGFTQSGGANGTGTVFELAAGSDSITALAPFGPPLPGAENPTPKGDLLIDSQGNLYGVDQFGGSAGFGEIYELAKGSNAITTLASFDDSNGAVPNYLIMDAAGNFFGTAYAGALRYGAIFELAAGSDTISDIFRFDGADGGAPNGLFADSAGNLYGTSYGDSSYTSGTIFELSGFGFVVPEPSAISLLLALAFPALLIRPGPAWRL